MSTVTVPDHKTWPRSRFPPPLVWTYGITTVPERMRTTFPITLESLKKAGFDEPHIFVDGMSQEDYTGFYSGLCRPLTAHETKVRTSGKWILSLMELYARNPRADRFAIFQDDLIACQNLKEYLSYCVYHEQTYWNLYMFPANQALANGRSGWYPSDQLGKSAVGLIFDRKTVLNLLSSTHLYAALQNPVRGHRGIDGSICTSLKDRGWKELVHNPNLVQHIGDISSMGGKQHPKASAFVGESFDAMELV